LTDLRVDLFLDSLDLDDPGEVGGARIDERLQGGNTALKKPPWPRI